jgi:hypothetical protein
LLGTCDLSQALFVLTSYVPSRSSSCRAFRELLKMSASQTPASRLQRSVVDVDEDSASSRCPDRASFKWRLRRGREPRDELLIAFGYTTETHQSNLRRRVIGTAMLV